MSHPDLPRPDRLGSILAWVFAIVILGLSLLVLDATGAFRSARPAVAGVDLPTQCPPPVAGEQLVIRIELRQGLLQVACRTVRPLVSMRGGQ